MALVEYTSLIKSEFSRVEIEVHETEVERLSAYCEELERWNKKINLTSLQGAALVRRLIVDPVWIAQKLKIQGKVCDIGSGNGSPAIPIRLAQPRIETLHLVEIRAKRVAFLRHLTSFLRIDHTYVHHDRFETAVQAIGPVDWITMQAVEPTESILQAARVISNETTRVVWITSHSKGFSVKSASVLAVPFSETSAIIIEGHY